MAVNTIGAGVILNEGSIDVDFRVESNGNANMLFVDGGNDKVGIGTDSPVSITNIVGADSTESGTATCQLTIQDDAAYNAAQYSGIAFSQKWHSDGRDTPTSAIVGSRDSTSDGQYGGYLTFNTRTHGGNVDERMRITSSGTLQVKPRGTDIGVADIAARTVVLGARPSSDDFVSLGFDAGGTYRGNWDFQASNGEMKWWAYDSGWGEKFKIERTGTATFSVKLSSDTQTDAETVAIFDASYTSTGADGGAGAGSRIVFKVPDDQGSKIGSAIGSYKISADDSNDTSGLKFYTSQNNETLNSVLTIDNDGNAIFAGQVKIDTTQRYFTKWESTYGTDRDYWWRNDSGLLQLGEGAEGDSQVKYTFDTANKRFGIGTASPSVGLHVYQKSLYVDAIQTDTVFSGSVSGNTGCNLIGSDGYWAIRTASNNSFNIDVYNGGSELTALSVDTTGIVGIGISPSTYALKVDNLGNNGIFSGGIMSCGSFENRSDIRLKENIQPLEESLPIVNQLNPVTFNLKEEKFADEKFAGFIAQEIEKVFPISVNEEPTEDKYKSIKVMDLIALLTKSIQELSAKVTALENA